VLKIEQKEGTSLVKLVLSRRKSGLQTERLSVPVILGEYRARIHSEPALRWLFRGSRHEMCFNDLCNYPQKITVISYIPNCVHELEWMIGISMTCFVLLSIPKIMCCSIRSGTEVRDKLGCISKYILPISRNST
jgi:hypothetical protein